MFLDLLALETRSGMGSVDTELSSPLAVRSDVYPIVRPIDFPRLSKREYGLDCESHAGSAYSDGLVLRVMRYPWRRVEFGVDAVSAPDGHDTTTSRFGMFLNNSTKVSYRATRLHQLDRQIQALPSCFDEPDYVCVRLG